MAKTDLEIQDLAHVRLIEHRSPEEFGSSEEMRTALDEIVAAILAEEEMKLSRNKKRILCDRIWAEMTGYGPLARLLNDPHITDIMTVGHKKIFVVHEGITKPVEDVFEGVAFEDEAHLLRIIHRFFGPAGKRLDEGEPIGELHLPEYGGIRVNAVLPPVALDGPALTIHKLSVDLPPSKTVD